MLYESLSTRNNCVDLLRRTTVIYIFKSLLANLLSNYWLALEPTQKCWCSYPNTRVGQLSEAGTIPANSPYLAKIGCV